MYSHNEEKDVDSHTKSRIFNFTEYGLSCLNYEDISELAAPTQTLLNNNSQKLNQHQEQLEQVTIRIAEFKKVAKLAEANYEFNRSMLPKAEEEIKHRLIIILSQYFYINEYQAKKIVARTDFHTLTNEIQLSFASNGKTLFRGIRPHGSPQEGFSAIESARVQYNETCERFIHASDVFQQDIEAAQKQYGIKQALLDQERLSKIKSKLEADHKHLVWVNDFFQKYINLHEQDTVTVAKINKDEKINQLIKLRNECLNYKSRGHSLLKSKKKEIATIIANDILNYLLIHYSSKTNFKSNIIFHCENFIEQLKDLKKMKNDYESQFGYFFNSSRRMERIITNAIHLITSIVDEEQKSIALKNLEEELDFNRTRRAGIDLKPAQWRG